MLWECGGWCGSLATCPGKDSWGFIGWLTLVSSLPCRKRPAFARRVVVIDSHSTDGTVEIAGAADAYLIEKRFHFLGRRFRFGGFSHRAVLLFRRGKGRFERLFEESPEAPDMEVHERIIVEGTLDRLKTPLLHQDFRGLEAYLERHNKYSTWEAKARYLFLTTGRWGEATIRPRLFGDTQQRRRFLKALIMRLPFEPWLWFLYHYVLRLGFLEGRPGLIASQIRAGYIAQARAKLYELSQREKETTV